MPKNSYRVERDSLGKIHVPQDAYYGAQTQRAVLNFPISGILLPRIFIKSLALLKKYAAEVNMELGKLSQKEGDAIVKAAEEVAGGRFQGDFVVDIFQTGSGTSTNMNANEVIASRANEILGGKIGSKSPVHPNDHVNIGQSSNDVIPSAIHIAALLEIEKKLLPILDRLYLSLREKSIEFDGVIKIGRTHLQDATPIRLGQEFSGYASQVKHARERIIKSSEGLEELALGGTAVGTGMNTHPEFSGRAIDMINRETGLNFREAENHFEAQAARDAIVDISGSLKALAVSLSKIANDMRWLGSGPRCGIGELILPSLQPGSSIMPGKVNPVVAESVLQVAAQVIGNDATITFAGASGNFELNVMMPVMAYNLLESIKILSNVCAIFTEKLIKGLKVNVDKCREAVEKSLAMGTALTPHIGYDRAAEISKEAFATGKTVREVLIEKQIYAEEDIEKILDPALMTGRQDESKE